ncbi:class I SAM-dependent methyltransferase [Candidatus Bathyarchaeota archaeon]|nr:MAG: class I SAM-dependent methyltransferase [Candidatus Bathyarchaeota archaeon]
MLLTTPPETSYKLDPSRYESQTFKNLGGDLVSKREIAYVSAIMSRCGPSNILEVGMGTGRILRNISTSENVVGLDLDREMVREFRRLRRNRPGVPAPVHLVVADAERLPFRRGCFGAVVCIRALKYVRRPGRAISEMCTVLQPKGRLVLEFSNILAPNGFLYLAQNISRKGPILKAFLPRTIAQYLRQSGMTVITMDGWHKLAPGLTTRLNNPSVLKIMTGLEGVLQRNTPAGFLSRSVLVHAVKTPS